MAIRYRGSLRTARMWAVADDIDSGSGPGVLEICTAAYAMVLATIPLAGPCGTVSGDDLNLTVPQIDTGADASGAAAVARCKNSDGEVIIDQLTVGHLGGSENLILNQATNDIIQGQQITLASATITHNTGL